MTEKKEEFESQLAVIRKDITSESNKRDQAIRENILVKESIVILVDFQRDGYTPEILRGLLSQVSKLAIAGEPLLSIKRFLDRLSTAKEVEELEALILNYRGQLRTLKK